MGKRKNNYYILQVYNYCVFIQVTFTSLVKRRYYRVESVDPCYEVVIVNVLLGYVIDQ